MSLVGQTLNDGVLRAGWKGGLDSGLVNPNFVEEYDSGMQRRIVELSNFQQRVQWRQVASGTLVKKQMSGAKIQKMGRSEIPGTNTPIFEEVKFTVDTGVISRTPIAMIDTFLMDYDHKAEISEEHAVELTEFAEPLIPLMAIKAAQFTAKMPDVDDTGKPIGTYNYNGGWWDRATGTWRAGWTKHERNCPTGFKGGTVVEFDAVGDEVDWQKIEAAILLLCKRLRLQNLKPETGILLMSPIQYYALMTNDRFAATTFEQNATTTDKGRVLRVNGLTVEVTNRLPKPEDIGETHLLSNAVNGNLYDTTLDDALCCMVWFDRAAVQGLDLISHRSSLYWNEMDKTWYLDDIRAFGLGPDKIHCAGGVFRNRDYTKATLIAAIDAQS